jgi:hypothetical protein
MTADADSAGDISLTDPNNPKDVRVLKLPAG